MNKFDEIYHTIMENYDSTEGSSPDSNFITEPPDILYHATYKPLLKSIQEKGLGNTKQTYWQDSKPGVVYLATSEEVAESYAEANEQCPEEWLDQIVVLKIKTSDLDKNALCVDQNVILDENDLPETFEYHGIITNFEII